MNRIREKAKLFRQETVELLRDMNKHRVSTALCFLASGVFIGWPSVNLKTSGIEKYVVNVGVCLVTTSKIIELADKARRIGI
jgi:hypothetical protein